VFCFELWNFEWVLYINDGAEVGNVMGLVGLMRAGSMHYCAAAMSQLPPGQELQQFAEAAEQLPSVSDAHLAAAQVLDEAVTQMRTRSLNGENFTVDHSLRI
jgi:hypothetical protein